MRYRLVVWDFDGTLADTLAMAFATYNNLALQYGFLPVDDPATVRNLRTLDFLRKHGIPLVTLAEMLLTFLTVEKKLPASEVARALWHDYQAGGRSDKPVFLRPHLSDAPVPCESRPASTAPKRQQRHLAQKTSSLPG